MTERLDELLAQIRTFVQRRNWERYHDPKNLAMAIGSEAGELLEQLRWVHSDRADDVAGGERKNAIEEEIADVGICLLMLCDRLGIDPVDAMLRKLEVNRQKYPVEDEPG